MPEGGFEAPIVIRDKRKCAVSHVPLGLSHDCQSVGSAGVRSIRPNKRKPMHGQAKMHTVTKQLPKLAHNSKASRCPYYFTTSLRY